MATSVLPSSRVASRRLVLLAKGRPGRTIESLLPINLCTSCRRHHSELLIPVPDRARQSATFRHSRGQKSQPFSSSRSPSLATADPTASSTSSTSSASTSTRDTTAATTTSESPTSPLDLSNHYTLFRQTLPAGPPPSSPFTISTAQLRKEFLHLQARYHPDKFPMDQKQRAEALSSTINTAYKTLADPLLRAQYLLDQFHGIDVLAEDQGAAQQDPETLMEVMEAQEAIEDASGKEEIERLMDVNKRRIERAVKALADAFDHNRIEEARKECIRFRFWQSLQDGLESWEPGKEVRLIH